MKRAASRRRVSGPGGGRRRVGGGGRGSRAAATRAAGATTGMGAWQGSSTTSPRRGASWAVPAALGCRRPCSVSSPPFLFSPPSCMGKGQDLGVGAGDVSRPCAHAQAAWMAPTRVGLEFSLIRALLLLSFFTPVSSSSLPPKFRQRISQADSRAASFFLAHKNGHQPRGGALGSSSTMQRRSASHIPKAPNPATPHKNPHPTSIPSSPGRLRAHRRSGG